MYFDSVMLLLSILEKYNEKNSKSLKYLNEDLEETINKIQQSVEFYLKSYICKESPYILLKLEDRDFKKDTNKDFSDFFTIEAKTLPKVIGFLYGSVFFDNKLQVNFEEQFKYFRELRNKAIHSIIIEEINIKKLIIYMFVTFDIFIKDKSLFNFFYSKITKKELKNICFREEDLFELNLKDISKSKSVFNDLNKICFFIFDYLDPKELKIIFNLNKNFRKNDNRYVCPSCFDNTESLFHTGTNIYECFICKKEIEKITMESCEVCTDYIEDSNELMKTTKNYKEENKSFCLECGASYKVQRY